MKKFFAKACCAIITLFIWIYFGGVLIFVPYYNFQYAKNNSFIKWVFLGEIIPTFKGIAWPYFSFYSNSNKIGEHINRSIEYCNEATKIVNKGEAFSKLKPEEAKRLLELLEKAYEEAKLADIDEMNRHFEKFGDEYRDKFMAGLSLTIEGYKENNTTMTIMGQMLISAWGEWYSENLASLRREK